MLNALVESVPPTFIELDQAIQSKDWISVNRFSHKLIPNMNMMGNHYLETEIKWMEDNAVNLESQQVILSVSYTHLPLKTLSQFLPQKLKPRLKIFKV